MERRRHYHDFYAPVDGVARKFALRADDGKVMWIGAMEPLPAKDIKLHTTLDCIIKLLHRGVPWAVFTSHRAGDIGAVIEAAEARRAEIYGVEVAA